MAPILSSLRLPAVIALVVATASCASWSKRQAADGAWCSPDGMGKETARAFAEIAGSGISGQATLVEVENGRGRAVHIQISLKGDPKVLLPGLHGVHLHEVGECTPPFKSAGGHFDPGPNGNSDPDANHPFHMGDLPNMVVNARGEGSLDAWTTRVTLSDGPVTLFDANGSSIILHKNPDRGIGGPTMSGVSGGPRLACGVIHK